MSALTWIACALEAAGSSQDIDVVFARETTIAPAASDENHAGDPGFAAALAWRMVYRLLPVAFVVTLLIPRLAAASPCGLENFSFDIPVNCPLVFNKRAAATVTLPVITARRDGQDVMVSAQLARSTPTTFEVSYYRPCGRETISETRTEDYDVLELALAGIQVGDELSVDGRPAGIVDNSGPCPTPYPPCGDQDDTIACPDGAGCTAGGPAGLGLGLALALLRRRARR